MENITENLITIFQFLLPGFITAWIFYSLTSFLKPSQFERVVQALIFTLFVKFIVTLLEITLLFIGKYQSIGKWSEATTLMHSVLIAVSLGFLFSYFVNNDKLHKLLRKLNITKETSYPSEWFGTFINNITYIVLHLKDERRLYGWPIEWPSEPTKGYFLIENPAWIEGSEADTDTDTEEKITEKRITGVDHILINVEDVRWVEFMENTWEKNNG